MPLPVDPNETGQQRGGRSDEDVPIVQLARGAGAAGQHLPRRGDPAANHEAAGGARAATGAGQPPAVDLLAQVAQLRALIEEQNAQSAEQEVRLREQEKVTKELTKENMAMSAKLAEAQAAASSLLQPPTGISNSVELMERFNRLQDFHRLATAAQGAVDDGVKSCRKWFANAVDGWTEEALHTVSARFEPATEKLNTLIRLLDVEYAAIGAGAAAEKLKGQVADRYFARKKHLALEPTDEEKKLKLAIVDLATVQQLEQLTAKRGAEGGPAGGVEGNRGGARPWQAKKDRTHS